MNKKQILLYINCCGSLGALAKVIDNMRDQVVIMFVGRDGEEHITLHKKKENQTHHTITHYSKCVHSKSGSVKVEASKRDGNRNPEKHAHYITNQYVYLESLFTSKASLDSKDFEPDKHLTPQISITMSIEDCRYPLPNKYSKIPNVTLDVDSLEFLLSVYFTKDKTEFDNVPLEPIATSLGYISFRVKRNP